MTTPGATAALGATRRLRRSPVGSVLPLVALLTACGSRAPQPIAAGTNVLLISLCSVRADHMSLHGYERSTTPALEALSRSSVVFEQALTQWPKTTPAFASLFTGLYPHDHGVMRVTGGPRLPDHHRTLAEILTQHDYATAAFVSSPALSRESGLLQGFAEAEETFRDPQPFRTTTARALRWLSRSTGHRPFFAWVHYNNAHQPYGGGGGSRPDIFVDDRHYDREPRVKVLRGTPLTLPLPPDHPFRPQILRPDMGGVRPSAVLPERPSELAFYLARYDAGILAADSRIGDLLEGVAALDLLDDTLVAVVGDHGEALGEHGYFFGHGRLPYDDVLRVPLMLRFPGGRDPRRVSCPVASFSLMPTILDAVGVPVPREVEAPSLADCSDGDQIAPPVFSESGYQIGFQVALRAGRWKLVWVPDEIDRGLMTGHEWELYDVLRDPGEVVNLHTRRPMIEQRLRNRHLAWTGSWRSRLRPPLAGEPPTDPEVVRSLRDLGYLD